MRYCERKTFAGPIHTFRLSAEVVRRALEAGETADAIVEFFEAHSKHPVPNRVKVAIREWGDPALAVRLLPAAQIHVDSKTRAVRFDVIGAPALVGVPVHERMLPSGAIVLATRTPPAVSAGRRARRRAAEAIARRHLRTVAPHRGS